MVHIILSCIKKQGREPRLQGIGFQNFTFALPMFGNLALKKLLADFSDTDMPNMHHFVNARDIIPAACFIQNV